MKIKFYPMLLAMALLVAVSCDDKEEGPSLPTEDDLAGAWELDEILDDDGDGIDFDEYQADLNAWYMVFDDDGNFVQTIDLGFPTDVEGQYELDGDELALEFDNGNDVDLKIVSFTEDEISVMDDDDFTFIFKRIDEDDLPEKFIDPSDSDALSDALVISGSKQNGSIPSGSTSASAPYIDNYQTSASVTPNNTLYVPFTFQAPSGYGGVYIQVTGASDYWDIEYNGSAQSGQVIIPVEIPLNILPGDFCMEFAIYDLSGEFSYTYTMCVTLTEPIECSGSYYASGSDGITVTTIDFGDNPGSVSINYEMYSLPDRLDVFYDGDWVTGTGPSVDAGSYPPASVCYDGTPGFVSNSGTLDFQYSPGSAGPYSITIYMSGCYGGTAWDYNVTCPQ